MRIVTACILTALIAAPASAQLRRGIAGPPPPSERIPSIAERVDPQPAYDERLARDLHDIRERIDDARDTGTLTRREGRRLDRENRQIGTLASRYGQDGLSNSERAELKTRAHVLRDQVNIKRMEARGRK